MSMTLRQTALPFIAALLSLAASPAITWADDVNAAPVKDAIVAKECSACHMLYPAGLLPAQSWQAVMDNLKNHFGDNAELDDATRKHVTDYLMANAQDGRERAARQSPGAAVPLRISEMPWFIREHRKGRVSPEALKRRGAKSPADCKACHQDAEKGYFEDD